MKTETLVGIETPAMDNQVVEEMESRTPIEDESEKLRGELAIEREHYLRLAAEYDNYRRRTKKERKEFADEGKRALLEQVITIEDDLQLALKNLGDQKGRTAEALKLIERRFQKVLLSNDVRSFDSQGEVFDPEIHEAFDVLAATDKHRSGTVHSEVRRGYFWKDKLLRPAIVVVAQ